MQQVKVSPKFQVVIPKAVREPLGIRPGQRLQVVPYGDRIELVPVREIGEMRGFLAGMDARFEREPDRELRMLATARLTGATLWTQDVDFEGLPQVRYVPKIPA